MASKEGKSHTYDATRYAQDVTAGKIPACHWVQLACERQLKDLERWKDRNNSPYYFDEAKAERICNFIEKLPHIKGDWAKKHQLIKLEPWQKFVWTTVFGWVRSDTEMRRFRESYVEVPRKNAKSTALSAIGLYMLTADDEMGSEVYSGAGTEKQAWEVFGPSRLMVTRSPHMRDYFGIDINAKSLSILGTASKFEPLIGKPGDGASPHFAIVDEFHEHQTSELYDTMITGMGARKQPLLAIITTAGVNLSSPCYDKRTQVCKMLDGIIENDQLFGIVYTIDKDDDWTDFSLWSKANPNYGVSVFEDYLKQRHQEAMQRASMQNIIQCKHLDRWMSAGEAFFNMVDWEKCADLSLRIEDFRRQRCWIGVDLAAKVDVAVMVELYRREDEYYCFAHHYLPEAATDSEDKSHYRGWAKEGWITLSSGSRNDFDVIEEDIRGTAKRAEVSALAHDPWNAQQLVDHLMKEKIPMVEVPQTVNNFTEPMKELEALILTHKIHHNGDPVLAWMMSNVMAKRDKKDNVFPFKERPQDKIDGAVALMMALNQAMADKKKKSKYETEGLLIL